MSCTFFFFKQKTAYEMRISDWSSDVCSSDLALSAGKPFALGGTAMIRSIKELCHYDIAAKDGSLGDVHDLFFDDSAWQVRYLVIDTGSWLPGRRVLVSPQAVENIDGAEEKVSVGPRTEERRGGKEGGSRWRS